jgi:hypothetical protein
LNNAGVLALICGSTDSDMRDRTRSHLGAENFVHIEGAETAERIHRLLKEEGIL